MILMVRVCATDSDILHQSHPSPGDLAMGGCAVAAFVASAGRSFSFNRCNQGRKQTFWSVALQLGDSFQQFSSLLHTDRCRIVSGKVCWKVKTLNAGDTN